MIFFLCFCELDSPVPFTLTKFLHRLISFLNSSFDFDLQILPILIELLDELILFSYLLLKLFNLQRGLLLLGLGNLNISNRRLFPIPYARQYRYKGTPDGCIWVKIFLHGFIDWLLVLVSADSKMRYFRSYCRGLIARYKLTIVQFSQLRKVEPHCFIVVLKVANRVASCLAALEYQLPQISEVL